MLCLLQLFLTTLDSFTPISGPSLLFNPPDGLPAQFLQRKCSRKPVYSSPFSWLELKRQKTAIGDGGFLPATLEKGEGNMKMLIRAQGVVASLLAMVAPTAMTARRRRLRFALPVVLSAGIALSGCAATQVYLENKDLQVQTRMSATVFLPPATPGKRTVWVDVRNTSDQDIDLGQLGSMLTSRGYRIVDDPETANYHLQANILYVGRDEKSAIRQS